MRSRDAAAATLACVVIFVGAGCPDAPPSAADADAAVVAPVGGEVAAPGKTTSTGDGDAAPTSDGTGDAMKPATDSAKTIVVNGEVVPQDTITSLEATHAIRFVPGKYWYDAKTGAFGVEGGPCAGIGFQNVAIGGALRADASGGGTGVFINGRDLHPTDVAGLQTFMIVQQGRYWMDGYGSFGYENSPFPIGNIYQLFQVRFGSNKTSSYYKDNPWSGEKKSFGGDGSFFYYSSKKADGTTYDYMGGN